MTDWQINNLLCDPEDEQGEVLSYPEILRHVWTLRGYTEDEVDQILHWQQVDQMDDARLWAKMEEEGIAR